MTQPNSNTSGSPSDIANGPMSTRYFQNKPQERVESCLTYPRSDDLHQNAKETPPMSIWLTEASSGAPAMDRLHQDFFHALEEVSSCKDYEFTSRYGAFVGTVERAFREEEQWMEDIDFPVLHMHQEQHARVLGALHNVHFRVMNGELQLGREVVEQLLPQWFAFHISTMDTALALAMQLKQNEAHAGAAEPT